MMPTRAGATLSYVPTWVEWSITAGGFAGFLLLFVLFSKVFPVISIWELDLTKWPKPVVAESRPLASGGEALA
jgi:hypothetical protein